MVARRLALLGNPVLRKVARHVGDPTSDRIRSLANDLVSLVRLHPGWGAAAPQIGVSSKMFVMATPKADVALPTLGDRVHSGEFERNPVHFTAFVNPRVVAASEELECDHETCLSIPGITALVPRHEWIDVEFTSLKGETCALRLQQHPARVFQHELDHLEGIVFLDRILATGDIMAQEELDRQAAELMKKQGALLRAQRKEAVSSALDVVFEQYL